MQRFDLPVNTTCENCVVPIESNILLLKSRFKDVSVEVNTDTKRVVIFVEDERFLRDEIERTLKKTLDDIGMLGDEEASPLQAQPLLDQPQKHIAHPRRKRKIKMHWIMGAIGVISGLGLLALTLSGLAIPILAMYLMMGASALLTLIIGAPTIIAAVRQLILAKTLTMDSVLSVSALISIGVTIASIFFPVLPMMCNAGLLIFGFRHIGQGIEESLKHKVNMGVSFFDRLKPFFVCRNYKKSDIPSIVTSEVLEPGHIIEVRKGDVIPVDGVCLDEDASIIESINDGIELPKRLAKNAPILAGMRVAADHPGDCMLIQATKNVNDSRLGKLNADLEKARQEKAPLVSTTQRALKWFLPAVLGLALISSLIIGFCFPPALAIPVAISCGISILVSACPCTLGMITPMAMKIGIRKAEDRGIIFRSGRALQKADQIDTVVFDLNGTLTKGKPEVTLLTRTDKSVEPKKLFPYINAMESNSSHPMAKAIKQFTANAKDTSADSKTLFSNLDPSQYHNGLRAKINDPGSSFHEKILTIGNSQLLNQLGILLPAAAQENHAAQHLVFIALDNKVIGYFHLQDPLRPDAKPTIEELKKMGKDIYICTGTDEIAARKYADELGIPHDKVKCGYRTISTDPNIPTKVQFIDSLQESGKKVAMVGDAGNDAIAIKKADLGIAMKVSDELTSQLAGANVLNDSLTPIVAGFEIAKQTVTNIKQNLGFSLAYNIIALAAPIIIATVVCFVFAPPLALAILAFALSPAIGAGLMILQSALVMGNAFWFKKQSLPQTDAVKTAASKEPSAAPGTTSGNLLRRMPKSALSLPTQSPSDPSEPGLLVEEDFDTYSPGSALEATAGRRNSLQ